MKIDITGGYVLLSEKISRKVARDYLEKLDETSVTNSDGDQKLTSFGIETASEFLVLALIEKVVMVGADGSETDIKADRDWIDGLDQEDFDPIQTYVIKKFNSSRNTGKK